MVASREPHPPQNVVIPTGPPPTLAPSVEDAYKRKCVELRRRMNEVEENNDAMRLRRVRLLRAVRKMRLERAILLDTLGKRMRKNRPGMKGPYDENSEDSSDAPPTVRPSMPLLHQCHSNLIMPKPRERPLRIKKSHRRAGSPQPAGDATKSGNDAEQPLAADLPDAPLSATTSLPPVERPSGDIEPMTAPALSQLADSHPGSRPQPPRELFKEYVANQYIPSKPEFYGDIPENGAQAWADRLWPSLSEHERQSWHQLYEELMAEYTRSEDQRKKAANAEWRQRRAHGKGTDSGSGSQGDTEMHGVEESNGVASGGFSAVNR